MIRPLEVLLIAVWGAIVYPIVHTSLQPFVLHHPGIGGSLAVVGLAFVLALLLSIASFVIFMTIVGRNERFEESAKLFFLKRLQYRLVNIDWVDSTSEKREEIAIEKRECFPAGWGNWKQVDVYNRAINMTYAKEKKLELEKQRDRDIRRAKDCLVKRNKVVL